MNAIDSHAQFLCLGVITPLAGSVRTCFQTLIGIEPIAEPFRLESAGAATYGITAVIGLSGGIRAFIALSFDVRTALRIASIMLGQTIFVPNEAVTDAIGELSNQIVGSARPKFPTKTEMSLPNVVVGDGAIAMGWGPRLVIPHRLPCSTGVGNFTLEISRQNAE